MAFSVGQISASVTADSSGFMKSIDSVHKKGDQVARNISKRFKSVGQSFMSVGSKMTAGITAPLVGAGGLALKTAADYESLRQSMNALNGSAQEGARQFERIKEFSATTPFQLKELADAQNMLQGFGLSADEAFKSMKQIGDIAAITGSDIEGIGVAFGQASAEGRLMTRDIRQLINQGVPAIKLLANTMGVAKSDVLDLASEGEISFEILQKAFQDATSEGGMFANGMKRQAGTLAGVFSTLKDNASIAMGEIGKAIQDTFDIKGIMQSMISGLRTGIDWFTSLSEQTKKTAFIIAGAIGAGGPVLVGLGAMATALSGLVPLISALVSPVGLVVAAIGGLAAAVLYVWDNWKAVKERISDISWWRNAIADMVQAFLDYNPISLIIDGFNALLSYFGEVKIPNPFDSMSNAIEGLKADTKEYENQFGSFTDAVKSGVSSLTGINLGNIFGSSEGAKKTGKQVDDTIGRIGKLQDGFNNVKVSAKDALKTAPRMMKPLKAALKGVGESFMATKDMLNQASQEIVAKYDISLSSLTKLGVNTLNILTDIVGQFTSALSRGMANAIMQGKSLKKTLSNIGELLASAAIQKGISILLSGGLAGGGFFGEGGGLLGNLLGGIFGGGKATGGNVSGSKAYMVGERGPELFMPGRGGTIIPNRNLGGQQKQISQPMQGGLTEKGLERVFTKMMSRLGPDEVFALAQKGKAGF